jgi:UDP-GlcNAc:undecaprenyl-phosphate/decaprenyl-phosphate GlcNAc-1-phosphate transferase
LSGTLLQASALFLLGALTSLVATRMSMPLALRLGAVDQPNPDVSTHVRPTPLLGGLGMIAGTLAALGSVAAEPELLICGGFLLLLALALYKDISRRDVFPVFQMLVQFGACVAVVIGLDDERRLGPMTTLLVAIPGVALINAVNFLDVMDGLCASVALIIGLGFWLVASHPAGMALSAGCLGFLFWNRPRARVFMGDAGSFFIALLLFALGVQTLLVRPSAWAPVTLLYVVPLGELAFTCAVRLARGRGVMSGDDSHASLLLLNSGTRGPEVVALFASMAALCTGAALLLD